MFSSGKSFLEGKLGRIDFRGLLDAVSFPVMVIDKDFRIVYANRAVADLVGFKEGDLLGKRCHEVVHKSKAPHPKCPVLKMMKTGRPEESEFMEPNLGGKWISPSAHPVKDSSGRINYIIHTIRDVTERKRFEEALRESELKFRVLSEQSMVGVYIFDESGFSYVNRAFCELVGRTQDQLLSGVDPLDLVHPEDRDEVKSKIDMRLKGEVDSVRYSLRFVRPDGSVRYCEAYSKVVQLKNRRFIVGNIVDRTEKVLAEERLRESEERLREIFNSVPVGIFRTTPSGKVLVANPWFLSLLGYEGEVDLENVDVAKDVYFNPGDRISFVEEIESKGEVDGMEIMLKRKDGSPVWVRVYAKAIKDSGGKTLYYEGSVIDVTRQKALEEQVAQMQKMEAIGTLAGGIAHDFNNILTAIRGYVELAMMEVDEGSPLHSRLSAILSNVERGASLVAKILAFGRKQPLSRKAMSINDEIKEVYGILRRIMGEDIEIKLSLADDVWSVEADPASLGQILMNLAANSRDAMPKGGVFSIETENVEVDEVYARMKPYVKPGRYVMLKVSDTGRGIPKEIQKKVFEPFFTTKERGKGTGLGLSMVYGLVKQHGGFIHVYSEEGKGTVFKVYFPACDEGEVAVDASHRMSHGDETSYSAKGVVLVVEDEDDVRDIMDEVLRSMGFDVVLSSNGEEGLSKFKELGGKVDLVISDLVMPKVSGEELYAEIKKINPDVKFLFISGYSMSGSIQNFIMEKHIKFIQKPFGIKQLLEAVKEIMEGSS